MGQCRIVVTSENLEARGTQIRFQGEYLVDKRDWVSFSQIEVESAGVLGGNMLRDVSMKNLPVAKDLRKAGKGCSQIAGAAPCRGDYTKPDHAPLHRGASRSLMVGVYLD